MATDKLSRRDVLVNAGCVMGAAASLGWATVAAQTRGKSPQQAAGYQSQGNGNQRCGNCLHFQPPSACRIVAGNISPAGWCRLYAAR